MSTFKELISQLGATPEITYTLNDLPRKLVTGMPRLKYEKNRDTSKYNHEHWGQRKLLLSEINFLNIAKKLSPITNYQIIYAGAAPGIHIDYLAELFPNYHFKLYDTQKFDTRLQSRKNVEIFNELFTDAVAYSSTADLFISDIRNLDVDNRKYSLEEREKLIQKDMEDQKRWALIIKPQLAMFKFRVTWYPGITKYFAGDIYIQPWAPIDSIELRLITDLKEMKDYNNQEYEEMMSYINHKVRPCHKFAGRSYDSSLEYLILKDYEVGESTPLSIDLMMNNISKVLNNPYRKPFKH